MAAIHQQILFLLLDSSVVDPASAIRATRCRFASISPDANVRLPVPANPGYNQPWIARSIQGPQAGLEPSYAPASAGQRSRSKLSTARWSIFPLYDRPLSKKGRYQPPHGRRLQVWPAQHLCAHLAADATAVRAQQNLRIVPRLLVVEATISCRTELSPFQACQSHNKMRGADCSVLAQVGVQFPA